MGNIFTSTTQTQKTDKGNQLYEFKRLSSKELEDLRISSYGYLI